MRRIAACAGSKRLIGSLLLVAGLAGMIRALADTTPDPVTVRALTGVHPYTEVASETIYISGLDSPAPLTIIGGAWQKKSNNDWLSRTIVNNSEQ